MASIVASSISVQAPNAGIFVDGWIGTVAVLLLLLEFESTPALLTVAVLDSVPGEETAGAEIVSVMGAAGPGASVGIVHVTTPAAKPQVQPVPDAVRKLAPAGSVSLTETADAGVAPRFETASV